MALKTQRPPPPSPSATATAPYIGKQSYTLDTACTPAFGIYHSAENSRVLPCSEGRPTQRANLADPDTFVHVASPYTGSFCRERAALSERRAEEPCAICLSTRLLPDSVMKLP
ncbi:hypothetical protein MHYP_G00294840 [Metynnis hypsauchen]